MVLPASSQWNLSLDPALGKASARSAVDLHPQRCQQVGYNCNWYRNLVEPLVERRHWRSSEQSVSRALPKTRRVRWRPVSGVGSREIPRSHARKRLLSLIRSRCGAVRHPRPIGPAAATSSFPPRVGHPPGCSVPLPTPIPVPHSARIHGVASQIDPGPWAQHGISDAADKRISANPAPDGPARAGEAEPFGPRAARAGPSGGGPAANGSHCG
jgi:hypothetical protein